MQHTPPPLDAAQAGPALPAPWSETARTTVSLLLFLHFFALAVGVASNFSPSPLVVKLRDVPLVRPYLQLLGWDISWPGLYSLTHADEADTDHTLEVDLRAGGSLHQVVLPPADIKLPLRRMRYARLAATVSQTSGNTVVESILPQAIANSMVQRFDASGGTIRCRRHFLQPTEAITRSADGKSEPYSRVTTVYEARILPSDGIVGLLKVEAAADVAPAPMGPARP